MSFIPTELLRMRVFGGSTSTVERRAPQFIPNTFAPIRAAQFESGRPVTTEMALAAEALSEKLRLKRRASR